MRSKAPLALMEQAVMVLVSAWGCMIAHNMLLFVLFAAHYASGKWKGGKRLGL